MRAAGILLMVHPVNLFRVGGERIVIVRRKRGQKEALLQARKLNGHGNGSVRGFLLLLGFRGSPRRTGGFIVLFRSFLFLGFFVLVLFFRVVRFCFIRGFKRRNLILGESEE